MLSEVKKLLPELKPFKKQIVLVAITGIIYALATGANTKLTKDLFDSLSKPQAVVDPYAVVDVALVMLALACVMAVSRYFHILTMNIVAESLVQNVRQKMQQKFMALNLAFHNNYHSGSGGLISRILNDIRTIQDGLRVVADVFLYPLQFLILIGIMIHLDWKLTLTMTLATPVIALILKSIARSMRKYIPQERDAMEYMTSTIKESLDGIRIIQSFNLEKDMADRLVRDSNKYLDIRKTVYRRQEAAGPSTELIATVVIIAAVVYTSFEIAAERSSIGTFMGFTTALLQLNPAIKRLQEAYVRIQEVGISSGRIFSIIESPSEVPQSTANKPFPKNWQKITYRDVSFSYGKELILKNVNLEINRGEVIALVGASGSGKSTIVNILERFFDATSGEVLINDVNITDINLKDLRRNIALVTQDVFLFGDTIEKNIWAGDYTRDRKDVEAMAKLANAHDFIMKTPEGYQSRVGDRGNLLSGGEKQRISIARAMFKDAPILILDEATSALDTSSEIEVQKGLDHLMEGRTAIIIAHRLSTIQKADKIVVLRQGEIVEVGTHQDLLAKRGEYFRFHSLQHT